MELHFSYLDRVMGVDRQLELSQKVCRMLCRNLSLQNCHNSKPGYFTMNILEKIFSNGNDIDALTK